MSKITIAIRFSDDTIVTFKAHKTEQYMYFSNILYLLDEELLKKYLRKNNILFERSAKTLEEHEDYDNDLAFFAPYEYGITFIDFKNKNIYDQNDYSIFMGSYALNIKLGFDNVLCYLYKNYRKIKIEELDLDFYKNAEIPCLKKDGYHIENVFELLNPEKSGLFNIYQAYNKNIPIYYITENDKKGFIKNYLIESNVSNLFNQISKLNDMSVIRFEVPGWSFLTGLEQENNSLLKALKKDLQFSEVELNFWNQ